MEPFFKKKLMLNLKFFPTIGTAWVNHPFPMGCPSCANRKSQVFSADLFKTSTLVQDNFFLLTPENRHVASPRLVGDNLIVYFDNRSVFSLLT